MIVGTLHVRLHLPDASSLKGKRFILHGLKERLRQRFNISLSEVGEKDLWQSADLAVAVVGDERRHLNQVLEQVKNQLSKITTIRITDSIMEFF